ncbi:MAG: leucine-rich repeat domain-containing protein [Kiritimatiellae bacterium]|nr:leucine-rich repeat domain-containing protein [Kiritimatiellia bacterium]
MNFRIFASAVSAFLTSALVAAGPGGSAPGGGGSSGGSFSYDSVISVTTNSDGSISRDGVVFGYLSTATSFSPDASITAIADGAFAGNTSLVSVDLTSSSVTEIPSDCFAGCTSLETATLPSTVVAVGSGAFAGCTSLATVSAEGLETIAEDAFRDCTLLAEAPDLSSAIIGTCAFANCPYIVYRIRFIRNDGSGKIATVSFPYGTKTRIPSLAKGLGWARRGYSFNGWETSTKNASDNTRTSPWKADWAYVSTPVYPGKTLTVYARWQLKDGYYQIRFNKNDGSGKWRTLGFAVDTWSRISTISALGWELDGYTFDGWATSSAKATAGTVWKTDGAWMKNATSEGKTLSIYAIWE